MNSKLDNPTYPVAGLNGDIRGTCVACLTPTDTGLAIGGEAEVHVAFLLRLGIGPEDGGRLVNLGHHTRALMDRGVIEQVAIDAVVEALNNGTLTGVPDGALVHAYRVCAACAAKGGLKPVLLTAGADLPVHRLRSEG